MYGNVDVWPTLFTMQLDNAHDDTDAVMLLSGLPVAASYAAAGTQGHLLTVLFIKLRAAKPQDALHPRPMIGVI